MGTHYVSPSGSYTWAESVDIAKPCSLTTANSNAAAGDTVMLRGGSYNVDTASIEPAASGTPANRITYQAYSSETPIFVCTSGYDWAIILTGKSYVVVDGVEGDDSLRRWIYIMNGAHYNEIKNCVFIGSTNFDCAMRIGLQSGAACTHNWIHHNVFAQNGYVDPSDGNDVLSLWQLHYEGENASDYNTIEDNDFYYGGHDAMETFTGHNVFKNNFFHNEGWMTSADSPEYGPDSNGKYGNRNFQMYARYSSSETFNLVEGNRFQASGSSPDDDGGDGFTITAAKNIVRFNEIMNAQNNGLLLKIGGATARSDNNRIYFNTIVWAGRWEPAWEGSGGWQGYSVRFYNSSQPAVDNVIKNNILYGATSGDFLGTPYSEYEALDYNILENNWLNTDGDPKFVDETHASLTSKTAPDLRLAGDSPCLQGGTHLTHANGSGSGSTALVVDDALYFQDGTWGSDLARGVTLFPDWIAIGTVGNVVEIESINYATNTITLASPMSWSDEDPIWLYKNSDGEQVLYGTAPNYGSYQGTGIEEEGSETVAAGLLVGGGVLQDPTVSGSEAPPSLSFKQSMRMRF